MAAVERLECPVCLELPEGEVHQCNEGHCCCVSCWNRLEEPRRCPECRQPLPQANRNRAVERAIAALEWSCEHCNEATTRGAKAAHLAACPQVPTACAAAAAGCRWAGMASEQAAHDVACPFAICVRMMAPLQAECQGLRARLTPLEAHTQQLQAQCDELEAHNAQLQEQAAALPPQAERRVRALERGVVALERRVMALPEGDAEGGGRRLRQRVGPAPHDPPPSEEELEVMELTEVVAALRAHVAVERVAVDACRSLLNNGGRPQHAAEAGAIEAVVEAMRAHPRVADVQEAGCQLLGDVCIDSDAAGLARRQRAADAGALEKVVFAMQQHPQVLEVQEQGCWVLGSVCDGDGDDAAVQARRQRAAEFGVIEAVVDAMRAYPSEAYVQKFGCQVLINLCGGEVGGPDIDFEGVQARSLRAMSAGAIEAVVGVLLPHALVRVGEGQSPWNDGEVQEVQSLGCYLLLIVCGGDSAAASAGLWRAQQAGARVAAAAIIRAHPENEQLRRRATELRDLFLPG